MVLLTCQIIFLRDYFKYHTVTAPETLAAAMTSSRINRAQTQPLIYEEIKSAEIGYGYSVTNQIQGQF